MGGTGHKAALQDRTELGDLGKRAYAAAGGAGVLALAGAFGWGLSLGDGLKQFLHSYLVAFCYFLSIALGALFFVSGQRVTRAGWSVAVRRVAELIASSIPVFGLLALVLLVPMLQGNHALYPWVDHEYMAHSPLLAKKVPYLNTTFFAIRLAFYFAAWTVMARYFLKRSVEQDASGDPKLTQRAEAFAAPAILVYALTVTFFSFDTLMSLAPDWYSTIFGVYFFAGCMISFFATLIVTLKALQGRGILARTVTVEHFHDVGKLMFGFIVFWAYIGFSQFMLYWYANIPEETSWFLHRLDGDWKWASLLLLLGHFVVPFLAVMSRHVKRSVLLPFWAGVMLVMHWLDLFWIVMPGLSKGSVPFHPLDVLCMAGVGGIFLAAVARAASGVSLLAVKDPRLKSSLELEVY